MALPQQQCWMRIMVTAVCEMLFICRQSLDAGVTPVSRNHGAGEVLVHSD